MTEAASNPDPSPLRFSGAGSAPRHFDGIVCFGGEDWWYHNRGHYDMQMMRRFSRALPVLYVNSIGMRMPSPREGRMFLSRIRRKLRSIRRGRVAVSHGFTVMSPVSIPTRMGMAATRPLLSHMASSAARKQRIRSPLVWIGCPTAAEIVDSMSPAAVVYQRTDRFEAFGGVDADRIARYDTWLKARADLTVFCSSRLFELESGDCRNACFADHGVDFNRFVDASRSVSRCPDNIAVLPRPRIGFVGGIDAHAFDPKLFTAVAKQLPDIHFVLVGACSLPAGWCNLPNVSLLGQRPFDEVPDYLAACDVLIMPWNDSPWIEGCNPVKLKEYLAAGRPVVTTDFPELRRYEGLVRISGDAAAFARDIDASLRDVFDARPGRDRVRSESWTSKAQTVLNQLAVLGVIPQNRWPALAPIKSIDLRQPAGAASGMTVAPATAATPGLTVDETEVSHAAPDMVPGMAPGMGPGEAPALGLVPGSVHPEGSEESDSHADGTAAVSLKMTASASDDGSDGTVGAIRDPDEPLATIGTDAECEIQMPPVDLAACVLLAGGLRPSPLVEEAGRSVLDLYLTSERSVLDCWIERLGELVPGRAGAIPIRVVHDSVLPPPWPGNSPHDGVVIEQEPSPLRGPAGIAKDLCVGYEAHQHIVLAEAARYPAGSLVPMLQDHIGMKADVTVASNPDGTPAGVYVIRCSALELVPALGFADLKEQWLRKAVDAGLNVMVHHLPRPGALELRTREQFLHAARVANNPFADVDSLTPAGNRPELRIICASAFVGPGTTIIDSIVMPGTVVGSNSLIVRSLLCPKTQIQAGTDIADAVVCSGAHLSDDTPVRAFGIDPA